MNFKNVFMLIVLAFLTSYFINSFFAPRSAQDNQTIKSGQAFIAPENPQEALPLLKEIQFVRSELKPARITSVVTDYANLHFSTHGAVLERLAFRKEGQVEQLVTIGAQQLAPQEKAFVLGLNYEAPFEYDLDEVTEDQDSHTVSYTAQTSQARIKKSFIVSKLQPKMSVMIDVVPQKGFALKPRIAFPSPFLAAIGKDNAVSGLVYTDADVLKKIAARSLDGKQGWMAPTLFGSENKYFIHALVGDAQSFVRRGYYNKACATLTSILEGPEISEPARWTLEFYIGPKTEKVVNAVDSRLQSAIEYSGWLAPLARLMLFIFAFLYSYVFSYGLAIILVTILIKLALFPLTRRSRNAMKRQGELEKKMAYIKQKYQNDPELLARERAELLKKYGMPGATALIPLLVQVAMMFTLSRIISTSVDFYQASFAWIPNLTAADPYYILPLFIAIAMVFNALAALPAQRITLLAMALVFGAFSVSLSAGVALYLATNAVLDGLLSLINKK